MELVRLLVLSMIVFVAATARAEPVPVEHSVTAMASPRMMLFYAVPLAGSVSLGGARVWDGRWLAGVRFDFAAGTRELRSYEQAGELGVVLHPGRKLDLILGWRVGHAYLDFSFAAIHTWVVAPLLELGFRLSRTAELRVAPFVVTAYYAGMWQTTLGPEVGLTWRR